MARNSALKGVAFTGSEQLFSALNALPREMRDEILKTAVDRAARPTVKAAKKHARKSRRTGALERSIAARVKNYKATATAVAIIGPDRGRYGAGKRLKKGSDMRQSHMPAKYAHLVEFGHYSAAGANVRKSKGTSTKSGTFRANSFILPKPFMRPAFAETKSQIESELTKGIGAGVERVRAKAIKAGTFKS